MWPSVICSKITLSCLCSITAVFLLRLDLNALIEMDSDIIYTKIIKLNIIRLFFWLNALISGTIEPILLAKHPSWYYQWEGVLIKNVAGSCVTELLARKLWDERNSFHISDLLDHHWIWTWLLILIIWTKHGRKPNIDNKLVLLRNIR